MKPKSGVLLYVMILGSLSNCLVCTSEPFRYTVSHVYTKDKFTGADISGRTISICPLLTERGPIPWNTFNYEVIEAIVREIRPEIKVRQLSDLTAVTTDSVHDNNLQFYRMLYNGTMVELHGVATIWSSITTDYLMVFHLRYGMSVSTFDNRGRKRNRIEAELWDCKEAEAVWRSSAKGICSLGGASDIPFIASGIKEIMAAFPKTMPSYDNGQW